MFKNLFSSRSVLFTLFLALVASTGLAGCAPNRVASLAAKIADFDVPEGYSPDLGMDANGYILVGYSPKSGQGHVYFFQAPPTAKLNANELEDEIENYQPGWKSGRTAVVDSKPVNIRGQQVTLLISEGTNSDRKSYLEYTAIFQGKGGPALISITTVEGMWGETAIMDFLASIR